MVGVCDDLSMIDFSVVRFLFTLVYVPLSLSRDTGMVLVSLMRVSRCLPLFETSWFIWCFLMCSLALKSPVSITVESFFNMFI